jgi:hypothetical protein
VKGERKFETEDAMTIATDNRGGPLARLWTPGRFLFAGGSMLLAFGVAGLAGVLGSISTLSVFNPPDWINWLHTAAGSLVVAIAFIAPPRVKLILTLFPAVAATAIGVIGLLFNKPALPDISDHLTHVAVGLLASWAVWNVTFGGRGNSGRPHLDPRPHG